MNDKVQNDKQGSNVEIIRHRTDTYRYLVIDRIASVVYRLCSYENMLAGYR